MKTLFVAMFALCSCGSSVPMAGIYDLTTNSITSDSPIGCATGFAEPMTIQLYHVDTEVGNQVVSWTLFGCGPVNVPNCEQEELYAASTDGHSFEIASLFTGVLYIDYNTEGDSTTMSGTGRTLYESCTWHTSFSGTKR
jgi:hypothetical protein